MTEIQSGQQHGDNAGQKDSIEGASPANRGDPDSHCSNISKVQDVGAQQDTEYPAGKGERRCIGRFQEKGRDHRHQRRDENRRTDGILRDCALRFSYSWLAG